MVNECSTGGTPVPPPVAPPVAPAMPPQSFACEVLTSTCGFVFPGLIRSREARDCIRPEFVLFVVRQKDMEEIEARIGEVSGNRSVTGGFAQVGRFFLPSPLNAVSSSSATRGDTRTTGHSPYLWKERALLRYYERGSLVIPLLHAADSLSRPRGETPAIRDIHP